MFGRNARSLRKTRYRANFSRKSGGAITRAMSKKTNKSKYKKPAYLNELKKKGNNYRKARNNFAEKDPMRVSNNKAGKSKKAKKAKKGKKGKKAKKSSVRCFTRKRSNGTNYTACKNKRSGNQLRKI